MPRLSFDAYRDPARRPRAIIWTFTAVFLFAAFVLVALGVTSTYWFCANGCHKVQDDTITAYNASSHNKISCMACHMPVNSDPITFVLHKAKALGELYKTVTNTYELPLNPESEVAEEMEPSQCTQCHGDNRPITPSTGIIINHKIHAENDVSCTMCHNRVAHPEDFELKLAGNKKHEDFMKMEACFRCHGFEKGSKAPGACDRCHPKGFELKPANHFEKGFYTKGGESGGHAKLKKEEPDYCKMCHVESTFCVDCHGVVMPHPADFQKTHGAAGKKSPAVCANCHAKAGTSTAGLEFCNGCHHKQGDPAKPWIPQHFKVVAKTGAQPCFECHKSTFCAECHVRSATKSQ